MAAHRIPYIATASLSHPEDLVAKLKKARTLKGFRMIHYFSPCPTGWKADSRHMVELARRAVDAGLFPLYEVYYGERLVINHRPSWRAVREYVELQGRFKHFRDEDIAATEAEARAAWERLEHRARLNAGP